ncbi:MAG: type II/IV secretion system ATPase subunit [Thermoplasmata archaeon]
MGNNGDKSESSKKDRNDGGRTLMDSYVVSGGGEVRIWLVPERNSYLYEALPVFPTWVGDLETLERDFISYIGKHELPLAQKESSLREWVKHRALKSGSPASQEDSMTYYLASTLFGYGKIDLLMRDSNVEDVSCGGPEKPVYVYHKKYGSMQTNIFFQDEREIRGFVSRLAERAGSHISIARPIVECSLQNGSRFHGTYGTEITKAGSTFAIRKFLKDVLTPLDLIRNGTMDVDVAAYLWEAIEFGMSSFIVGGTATGKTTTLNSLLLFVPGNRKIISIEDTREIDIPHANWVPLYTRQGRGGINPATGMKAGEIGMFDLLVASLRQRADYVVIGEVRGSETKTVFQAMSSGQPALATFHANDVSQFIHRLEGPPIEIPKAMISSLDIIVFQGLMIGESGISRRVVDVVELGEFEQGNEDVALRSVFLNDRGMLRYSGSSRILRKMAARSKQGLSQVDAEIEEKKEFLLNALKMERAGASEFLSLVNRYYAPRERPA